MSETEKNQLTDDEIALVLGGMSESTLDERNNPLFAYFCPTYDEHDR